MMKNNVFGHSNPIFSILFECKAFEINKGVDRNWISWDI